MDARTAGPLAAANLAVHVAATLLVGGGIGWLLLADHAMLRFGAESFGIRLALEDPDIRRVFLGLAVLEHATAVGLLLRAPAGLGIRLPVVGEALVLAIWLALVLSWRALVAAGEGGPPGLAVAPARFALPWLAAGLWGGRCVLVAGMVGRVARGPARPRDGGAA